MKPVAGSELWSTEHIPCTDTPRVDLYKYRRIYLEMSYKYPVKKLRLRFTEANVLHQRESKLAVKEIKILTGNLNTCKQSTHMEQNQKV
jgi:hypothetical protein